MRSTAARCSASKETMRRPLQARPRRRQQQRPTALPPRYPTTTARRPDSGPRDERRAENDAPKTTRRERRAENDAPKKMKARSMSGPSKPRQRPTLPQSCPCSTIGPGELNFRVRDGNGCDLSGVATRKKINEVRSPAGMVSGDRQCARVSADRSTSHDPSSSRQSRQALWERDL
jgi:hypothetical protein